jgi:Tripartite tricarboxylate transporter TctB family
MRETMEETGNSPADSTVEEKTKSMRDKDVLFSIILMLGSCSLILYSLFISFEAMKAVGAKFYTAPGFPVMIAGGFLFILSISLLVTALKQGGNLLWLAPKKLARNFKSKSFRQTIAVFFYLYLYMCLFWEKIPWLNVRVPFWLTTFVFLNLMMITFRAAKIHNILIISAITSFLVVFFFSFLGRIPLP